MSGRSSRLILYHFLCFPCTWTLLGEYFSSLFAFRLRRWVQFPRWLITFGSKTHWLTYDFSPTNHSTEPQTTRPAQRRGKGRCSKRSAITLLTRSKHGPRYLSRGFLSLLLVLFHSVALFIVARQAVEKRKSYACLLFQYFGRKKQKSLWIQKKNKEGGKGQHCKNIDLLVPFIVEYSTFCPRSVWSRLVSG